jgi:hypothetical protein
MARVICQNTFLEMSAIEDEEPMRHGIRKRSMTADVYFREEPFNVVVDSQLQRLNRLLDSNDRPLIVSVSVEEHDSRLVQLGRPFDAPCEDSGNTNCPRASSSTSSEKLGRALTSSTRASSPSSQNSSASSPRGRETWADMEDEEGNDSTGENDEAASEHSPPLPSRSSSPVNYTIVGTTCDVGVVAQAAHVQQRSVEWVLAAPSFWSADAHGYCMSYTDYSPVNFPCPHQNASLSVNLKNLPPDCTLNSLLETLDREGFSGYYDFVHVPISFVTKLPVGYAQVNLCDHASALCLCQHFQGFRDWASSTNSSDSSGCCTNLNTVTHGLRSLIERYRNSPLMHQNVPEDYKPALFRNGQRICFPAPTARIKAPRVRHQKRNP